MRLIALALAALPMPLLAEVYTVASAPSAVTVYAGFATVTRAVQIEVTQGAHEIVLPDLPQWLDPASIRASVAGAQIISTRLRGDALPPQPDGDSADITAAKARIAAAERALRDLDDAVQDAQQPVQAAEARLQFLTGLSEHGSLPADADGLRAIAEMIADQTLAATTARTNARRAARSLAEARPDLITALEDARATLAALTPQGVPQSLFALSIEAAQAGPVTATVSYPVQASWQPTYDVILDRATARLTLRRAALISQSSGENWEGVALTLSTLTPSGQVAPSDLFPPLVRFEDANDPLVVQRSQSASLDAAAPMALAEATALPVFDGPGVSYTLPRPITIAQNAENARLALDALTFDARVFARAVPARDTTAFLMAEAINTSAEPLLAAGQAQIFLDGALVGRAPFAMVPPGGDITAAFGPLEALRLTHTVLDRSEGDRGLITRSNARTEEVRMTLENLGETPLDVELREAVPYSEQDDLLVEWRAEPSPDITAAEDRRGLLEWRLTAPPKTRQTVVLEQVIRWPDGKVLR